MSNSAIRRRSSWTGAPSSSSCDGKGAARHLRAAGGDIEKAMSEWALPTMHVQLTALSWKSFSLGYYSVARGLRRMIRASSDTFGRLPPLDPTDLPAIHYVAALLATHEFAHAGFSEDLNGPEDLRQLIGGIQAIDPSRKMLERASYRSLPSEVDDAFDSAVRQAEAGLPSPLLEEALADRFAMHFSFFTARLNGLTRTQEALLLGATLSVAKLLDVTGQFLAHNSERDGEPVSVGRSIANWSLRINLFARTHHLLQDLQPPTELTAKFEQLVGVPPAHSSKAFEYACTRFDIATLMDAFWRYHSSDAALRRTLRSGSLSIPRILSLRDRLIQDWEQG